MLAPEIQPNPAALELAQAALPAPVLTTRTKILRFTATYKGKTYERQLAVDVEVNEAAEQLNTLRQQRAAQLQRLAEADLRRAMQAAHELGAWPHYGSELLIERTQDARYRRALLDTQVARARRLAQFRATLDSQNDEQARMRKVFMAQLASSGISPFAFELLREWNAVNRPGEALSAADVLAPFWKAAFLAAHPDARR